MFKVVEKYFDESQFELLREEAQRQRPHLKQVRYDEYRMNHGHLYSPARFDYSEPGPVLDDLQRGSRLRAVFQELFDADVQARSATYNYYSKGDYLGVHRDAPDYVFDVLISLTPSTGPLTLYPDAELVPAADLCDQLRSGAALGRGVRLDLPLRSIVIIEGSRFPHERTPVPEECIVATMAFSTGLTQHHRGAS